MTDETKKVAKEEKATDKKPAAKKATKKPAAQKAPAKATKKEVVKKKVVKKNKKTTEQPKLRIKLKSYDVRMLEASLAKVVGLLVKSNATIKGPIPLPKKRKVYTVLKSNFVYKDAREQFERNTYARLIDVTETGPKTMEYLQNLSIPVGVLVDVKVY